MKNCLFIFVVSVIVGGVLMGCKKGEVMKGTCGDNLQWELRDSVLTISGSGDMEDECFSQFPDFRKVIIKKGVTSIGDWTFYGCENLTSVVIPNSVTGIGNNAFRSCKNLTSVVIPNSVTSIGDRTFQHCTNLTTVVIPNSVTSIGDRAFNDISNIEYHGPAVGAPWGALSVNGYIEENLVYNDHTKIFLRACFRTAKGKIVIPNSVKGIGDWAFNGCENLTSVVIPNGVKSIGYGAFCENLTSVVIPNSVTSIGNWAFNNISNIEYHGPAVGAPWGALSVNGYIEENLVYNDHTKIFLRACFRTAKGKIVIPNGVTSIGYWAFYGCENLTSVVIPNSVTSIGYGAFYEVPNIEYRGSAVGAPWGALSVNGYIEENLVYNDHTKIFLRACFRTAKCKIVIPNSVTGIGNNAFRSCKNLTSVVIPNSVTSIGDRTFQHCTNLTTVVIPNSVTSIGDRAFIDISNIEYHGPADGAPWGALSVNGYIEENLVYNDHTKIFLRACFHTAKGKIVIPNSVKGIGDKAFAVCKNLTSVIIPNGVTSIGYGAFYDCINLTSVVIPNSVKGIGDWAFAVCKNLTSVIIPNSVTSIGYGAFYDCINLTSVVIPNSVTSIGKDAFSGVSNIEYHGSADGAPWGAKRLNGIDYKNYNRE